MGKLGIDDNELFDSVFASLSSETICFILFIFFIDDLDNCDWDTECNVDLLDLYVDVDSIHISAYIGINIASITFASTSFEQNQIMSKIVLEYLTNQMVTVFKRYLNVSQYHTVLVH